MALRLTMNINRVSQKGGDDHLADRRVRNRIARLWMMAAPAKTAIPVPTLLIRPEVR
jgi:hypothetical protein